MTGGEVLVTGVEVMLTGGGEDMVTVGELKVTSGVGDVIGDWL